MLTIRKILMRGPGVHDAAAAFSPGGNILAGVSDTGKSLLLHCLDYILGADEMGKRIPQTEPYSQLLVEFANGRGDSLTLERSLSGGDLAAHNCRISEIASAGKKVAARRRGKSIADDVSSVVFPFAGISEARLRANDRGETQRLTIRTMMPLFLVDEISVIAEQSPVLGPRGFDDTARKRMFAFVLSGKDDTGIIAAERRDVAMARLNAQLGVIGDLLAPVEKRLEGKAVEEAGDSIEKVEAAIAAASSDLAAAEEERTVLQDERREASDVIQRGDTQVEAIDQLLVRYSLLDQRYGSDLDRLDFVTEGAYFFDGLQEVACPLCDQPMGGDHLHAAEARSATVYEAARAEAAKILAQRADLAATVGGLQELRAAHSSSREQALINLTSIEERLRRLLGPRLAGGAEKLERLLVRRVELETLRGDADLANNLRLKREELEQASKAGRGPARDWEPLPSKALRVFCGEVEEVLAEWGWKGAPRVEFDQKTYDIVVDGQPRQSHGKGVRGVLYSAFAVGLLRYCASHGRSHPGTVVIDSPLTAYKKAGGQMPDNPVDHGLELGFWNSLASVSDGIQIIILENKEPPREIAEAVHYEWFAGDEARVGERKGFVPVSTPGEATAPV